jgi:signal transduction histidine kinase/CheY-like chemotaxis protein
MDPTIHNHVTPRKRRRFPSLSTKYSVFTGFMVGYMICVVIAYDVSTGDFRPGRAAVLCAAFVLLIGAIAKFTHRVLARPLQYLQQGLGAVTGGRLTTIQVSRTRDEIEFLGESFNAMIRALARSQAEVRGYQESLEARIRERTAALDEATRQALAASQTKSEFLANMSHELRTPMSGVLGMIDIVLESRLDAEQREQLLTAKNCAVSLLALLNDILDLSKIEVGKMILEEIPFDLRSVVSESVEAVRPGAQAKQLALRTVISPEAPAWIVGDSLRLRQVLQNLLSNAVKFTLQGSVELRLSVLTDGDSPSLVIEVADTGIGVSQDRLSDIFEKFTQANGSVSRKFGGTGLGLAITQKLVRMMGGGISVSSEPGTGSTFRVVIPCRPLSPSPEERPAEGIAKANQELPLTVAPGRATILLAEDNPVNQKVVMAMLQRYGYHVHVTADGGEVLPALARNPADLVLMDVQMPGVDGLEAARSIRSHPRWKNLPIIALTAHAMIGDQDLCLASGMDDYITKPVNWTQLIEVIEKHLAKTGATLGHDRDIWATSTPATSAPSRNSSAPPTPA